MLRKNFGDSLNEADLQWLIESTVPEGKTLEYKREVPDGGDAGKVKFLKAITAFANTDGGDLIFGINADEGIAKSFSPLDKELIDSTLLRLESLIASSTDPRLSGILFQQIPLATGGSLIAVRVRRSWNSPHRVIVGNHAHFYARNSAGCYQMDTSELRRAFTLAESFADRIREFRSNRFSQASSNKFPISVVDRAKMIVNIIPLSAFFGGNRIQLDQQTAVLRNISPPGATSFESGYNLDGWISFSRFDTNYSESYTQIYRNGVIEGMMALGDPYSDEKIFYPWFEEQIVEFLQRAMKSYSDLGIIPPIYVGLSLVNVQGYSIQQKFRYLDGRALTEPSSFVIPEAQVDDLNSHPSIYMKASFDSIWNAFGFPRSFNYSTDGTWAPPKSR